jgi:hypothetical protein
MFAKWFLTSIGIRQYGMEKTLGVCKLTWLLLTRNKLILPPKIALSSYELSSIWLSVWAVFVPLETSDHILAIWINLFIRITWFLDYVHRPEF